jgi:methionine--tRNA ligase beta chain
MINIEDFAKIELRVGSVVECEEIEGSDKLLKLTVDMGEEQPRTILSGIKQWFTPEDIKGKQFIFVANLEPRKMMGLESQGMILAAGGEKPVPLIPSEEVPAGTKIR